MVLENKLGITSSSELAREEERLTKAKAKDLFESGHSFKHSLSMESITIRKARPSDSPMIYQMYAEEKWVSFVKDIVDKLVKESDYLVAENGNQIVGFARYISDDILTTFLAEIIVCKDYRRQGIGRKLISEIHKEHPRTRIELISDVDTFYESQGFANAGQGYRLRSPLVD